MNALTISFFGILALPFALLLCRVIMDSIASRKASKRLREAHHRGTRIVLPVDGPRYKLPPRGDTLLESLLMIVFCAVVAAAIVVCLSDEEDLQVSPPQSLQVFSRKERP